MLHVEMTNVTNRTPVRWVAPDEGVRLVPQPDLCCEIAGVPLRNPLVLASGILGNDASLLERCAGAGAGAVTSKSCGPAPRQGPS